MISQQSLNIFKRLVTAYEADEVLVNDLACAICTADQLFGTNPQRLSIDRLAVSGVDMFTGFGKKGDKPLPDVQVMRVICDVCYYIVYLKKRKLIQGTHLTSEKSHLVASELKFHDGVQVTVIPSQGYANMEECEEVLSRFDKSLLAASFNRESLVKAIKDCYGVFAKEGTKNFPDKYRFMKNYYLFDKDGERLILPQSIRGQINDLIGNTEYCSVRYVDDNEFVARHLGHINAKDYSQHILAYFGVCIAQNFLLECERRARRNNVDFVSRMKSYIRNYGVVNIPSGVSVATYTHFMDKKPKFFDEVLDKLFNFDYVSFDYDDLLETVRILCNLANRMETQLR